AGATALDQREQEVDRADRLDALKRARRLGERRHHVRIEACAQHARHGTYVHGALRGGGWVEPPPCPREPRLSAPELQPYFQALPALSGQAWTTTLSGFGGAYGYFLNTADTN